jgi:hypothetical protein
MHAGLYCYEIEDYVLTQDEYKTPSKCNIQVPLTGVLVEANIFHFFSECNIVQTYYNSSTKPIEAIYTFPLNNHANVTSFEAEYTDNNNHNHKVLKGN